MCCFEWFVFWDLCELFVSRLIDVFVDIDGDIDFFNREFIEL